MNKKSKEWAIAAINLLVLVPSLLRMSSHFVSSLEHDSHRAKEGLFSFMLLIMLAIPLTVMAWLCICAIVFIWLQSWLSVLAATTLLLLAHILLLFNVIILLKQVKNKLLFERTRDLFRWG